LCSETLKGIPNVFLSQTAVGGFPRMQAIHVQNDSSGLYGTSEKTEEVWVSPLTDVLKAIGLDHVDLIKINIEGSEFEVLEHVLEHGLEPKLRNIQVQFHPVVPNSAMRYDNIRKGLLKTHRETWNCPWIWENYELL
jgi:FkbM family methyltransferase